MTTAVTKKEETGLSTIESGQDVKAVGAAALAQYEIQSAIIVAKKFPRDEAVAFARLMKAALRPSFAEDASYSFPRGTSQITGPSVNVAREGARAWGNIRYGLEVIRDDETTRLIRGWAWDMETNTKVEAEDDFQKLIQRRQENGKTAWVTPDERDMRELTNRRGAFLVRNCILQLLPKDLIEDALFQCTETLRDKSAKDPEGTRKRLIVNFGAYNVTPAMIAQKLGHPLAEASPDEMAELQAVYASIKDGNSTWKEYVQDEAAEQRTADMEHQLAEAKGKVNRPASTTLNQAVGGTIPETETMKPPPKGLGFDPSNPVHVYTAKLQECQTQADLKKVWVACGDDKDVKTVGEYAEIGAVYNKLWRAKKDKS